ncbi:hypothetical protein ACFQI3_11015 [Hansschlegelia quercus]|uniref:Uncharacterized protein n=1 Tax=Hansschlegelia quercus TaxID=2528245 RepID=A0A4Q9G9T3_9HYPH|nr:hypothetical protein [Hansschlegelia quercus]TBN47647.1 hypothetical protein EYR15_15955 [Hansschlegelia quercus]
MRDDDEAQTQPERRERVQPAEERRKSGGRRREDREAARSKSRPARAYAPLVAQLIATSIGAPQTRSRRRATVQAAIDAYEKAAEPAPSKGGSTA